MLTHCEQTLCAPSFEVLLAPGGVKNNPDLLEDFFRLASKFVSSFISLVCPSVVVVYLLVVRVDATWWTVVTCVGFTNCDNPPLCRCVLINSPLDPSTDYK